ncbi:PAS domain-containing sensor histidine kinase [Luteibaculum oceani]|uniref:histidine kinase n=1 Tax=Luteibaculum oceani TaxID=1294296 RepID=A0A5C6USX1_9FLAO|nr:PAS domain-containing sensor histidine kinase [Luteibaculum oceani]TXC76079.1 hypothetical protein FRX97_11235 [Luteibaculum oceani]
MPPFLPAELSFSILENLPVGIFILKLEDLKSKEFRNIYVNPANSKIVGIDFQPFVGKTLRESFPDSYKHGLPDAYIKALQTGETVIIGEMDYGDDKVERKTWYLEAVPIDHEHVMLTTENITELSVAKRLLEQRSQKLEHKNKEMEQFTYMVSHDLKSPMNSVIGWINLLKEEGEEMSPLVQQAFNAVDTSVHRMKRLVEDILDYALIGTSKKEKSQVNLTLICKAIVEDLKERMEISHAQVVFDELPVVEGFETELRQLLQNLIHNAIKFTGAGVDPLVKLENHSTSDFHIISIADNGIGIAKEDQEKIFGVFNRLNLETEYSGSGIGLANCKKIVDLHNGTLWVDSELGKGSVFHIKIPKNH